MTTPDISVVLPSFCSASRHGTSRLLLTLVGYGRQTLPAERYEVVVVDNGSDPPLAEQVQAWDLGYEPRVVRREEIGLGAGYNSGIAHTTAPLVLLALDDEIPSPNLLHEHVRAHAEHPGTVAMGRCRFMFHTRLFHDVTTAQEAPGARAALRSTRDLAWIDDAYDALAIDEKAVTRDDVVHNFDKLLALSGRGGREFTDIEQTVRSGHCSRLDTGWLAMRLGNHSVHREQLAAIGGFDEQLDAHDGWYLDLELGLRALTAGLTFHLVEDAVTINLPHPRSAANAIGMASGLAYLYAKHRRVDVAMMPLYFQRRYTLAEYARVLRSAQRWWPDV